MKTGGVCQHSRYKETIFSPDGKKAGKLAENIQLLAEESIEYGKKYLHTKFSGYRKSTTHAFYTESEKKPKS